MPPPPRQYAPIPVDTTDGIPQKWLHVISGNPPKYLSPQDVEEILGIAKMLEGKGKFQKAANLLYGCVMCDHHNLELRARWDDLVAKTNVQEAELVRQQREQEAQAALKAQQLADRQAAAVLSETQRWNNLRENNKLPAADPNWHLAKLKPWMGDDALALGMKYKEQAASARDPFDKVFQLEEACKMFTKVLEIKPQDDNARRQLSECCAIMNTEYQRMKGIKKMDKALNPNAPLTSIGDFMQSQVHGKPTWVAHVRTPGASQRVVNQHGAEGNRSSIKSPYY